MHTRDKLEMNRAQDYPIEMGSATVSVVPAGVSPTGSDARTAFARNDFRTRSDVYGRTPETAGETPALLNSNSRILPIDFHGPIECDSEHTRRIMAAAIDILGQGEDLLRVFTAESFTRKVPVVFNASIGGHYRHCLDHFTSLLLALDADEVDYDHRKRDPRIETQPDFALALTVELRRTLERLTPDTLCTEVKARCEVSYTHGNSPVTRSTLARELVYCIAHAIHHYALISVMARLMEVKLPAHFGVAPGTVAHQKSLTTDGHG